MNIRKTIITAAVALTTVAMIAPATVGAVTIAELQAQINALMAQLNVLQASSTTTSSTPAVCAGITFTRNLIVGATGSDVKCLQALLNTSATTKVSMTGAGSPGSETMTFGPKTLAAVRVYQAEQGWAPASQVGPLTRAKLNAWLGGTTPTPVTPGTPPVPTGAGLTVRLASDNPAAGTVVGVTGSGSALNPMLALTFLNGDNAEVKITGLKLKRIGVAADASITNTYLFKGAARLTDGSAVSETIVNFNSSGGLFMVPAGGSTTIWVLSDVDGAASETVGFQVVSASSVTSNASSVKGTFPVSGNVMTIATGTLAGVEWNATTTPAASSIDPQDGYTAFQNSVVVTTRAVDLTRIAFKKTGSVSDTDLKNFKLYIDGVQVGSAVQLAKNSTGDSYATFDLTSAPKRMEAGTRVVKVLTDVVGGSSLTFTTHVWNVADATLVDTQYKANVVGDLVSDATFSKRSSGEQTINGGTITVTKTLNSPSGDIVDGASNALLGKWEAKAAGEKVKIETLNVRVIFVNTVTTGDNDTSAAGDITIRNGALYANGVQIGSTTSTINGAAGTQFSLGSSLIVEPGSPVTLEFRGDVYDNKGSANDIDATDTLQASIIGSSTNNNATGQVSSNTIDAPASNVNANVMTVRQGSLTLSKYTAYTDHSVVTPLTAYKLGHYTLTAATSEAVNLSTINVTLGSVSTYITNLYVKYGTQTTSVKPTITNANSWSINHTLPAGSTIDVTVYADVASGMNSGTSAMVTDIDATTASSAVSADSSGTTTGQTLTYTSGSLATAFDATPQNQTVSGNQSVLAGRFKFTSSYQEFTAKELRFTTGSSLPISSATLKDTTTGAALATVPYDNVNSYFNFTGLNVLIPASTVKRVDLFWNLTIPSATSLSTNVNAVATLDYIKYADPSGTETESGTDRAGNETYVFRSVPTVTHVPVTKTTIINGATYDFYKFTVAAPVQGPVGVKQFKIDLNWSDGGGNNDTLEVESIKLLKDGVDITTSVSILDQTGGTVESTSGVSELSSKLVVSWDGATEDTVPANGSTTYTIRGVAQGFNLTATVSTAIATDSVTFGFTPDATRTAFSFINVGTTVTGVRKLLGSAAAGDATAVDANLIWSDLSAVAHLGDVGATSTRDWSNSYLFPTTGVQAWHD